jgi:hypothetical protein
MIIEKSDGTTGSYHADEEFEQLGYGDGDEDYEGDVMDDNDDVDAGLLHENDEEELDNAGRAGSAFQPHGPRASPPAAAISGATAAAAPRVRGTTPSGNSSSGRRTPTPTPVMLSSRFANQLQGMRSQPQQRYNKPGDDGNGFSFQNMMGLMLMQQQNDREERIQQAQLDREIRAQQVEQMRLECEKRGQNRIGR